jgi:hypothetical protein
VEETAMKRDMDLIRQMALTLEASPTGYAPDSMDFDGYTAEQVAYHAYLMLDQGLAEGLRTTTLVSSGPEAQLTNLTSAGHDFAEAARDDTRWKKAMTIVRDKGGSVTLPILIELLKNLMRTAFGLP